MLNQPACDQVYAGLYSTAGKYSQAPPTYGSEPHVLASSGLVIVHTVPSAAVALVTQVAEAAPAPTGQIGSQVLS